MNTKHRNRLMRLRYLMEQKAQLPEYRDPAVASIPAMNMTFNLGELCKVRVDSDLHTCPTAGCAIGHAMFDSVFNEDGLTATKMSPDVAEELNYNNTAVYFPFPEINGVEVGYSSWYMAEYFGITRTELQEIVEPDNYHDVDCWSEITPDMVIGKIDAVLENYHEKVL